MLARIPRQGSGSVPRVVRDVSRHCRGGFSFATDLAHGGSPGSSATAGAAVGTASDGQSGGVYVWRSTSSSAGRVTKALKSCDRCRRRPQAQRAPTAAARMSSVRGAPSRRSRPRRAEAREFMAKGKQAQALAIKLSRERRAGTRLVPAPPKGRYSEQTRRRALKDLAVGRERAKRRPVSAKRKR